MRILIAKFVFIALITTANAIGKKYLGYDQGLKARKWIENNLLTRMRKWVAKTKTITVDDGLVGFLRGVLKSETIKVGAEHA